MFKTEPFELEELSIAELHDGLAAGRFTARSLTESYLRRISELDRQGPKLHAVIELNPDALAVADALDRERRERGTMRPVGPLHGIPILLKDNIDTADRMTTTAGSLAMAGSIASRDAAVARRLRTAGAIFLGKTNLTEWANFRSARSISGWSGRGGQTRNPYALDRNPNGSSSGSGVAVSANLCAAAIGTETDGSIVFPSSANAIVGIKPTLGLIDGSGIVPIARSQDTAGPMARTVADAALLLSTLVDNGTDYTKFLDKRGLKGARIGVARSLFGCSAHADRLIEECMAALRHEGAELIDPANIETVQKLDASEHEVLLYEFKAGLNAYLASLGDKAPVRSLKELIAWNDAHRAEELSLFGQDLFIAAEAKGGLDSRPYRAALARNRRLSRTQGIDAALIGDGKRPPLDALIAPSAPPPWSIDPVSGDPRLGRSAAPAAVAGYPSISVPAGQVFGLPVGISFIGKAGSEPALIRLAYAFEQATRLRRLPRFLPTAQLG